MSNNQHNDQDPRENTCAHVNEPSTPPTQDSSVSNRTATTQAPATVWDLHVQQAIIPEPPPLENLGPVIEVDEQYLGPNPASYFMPDSTDSQAGIGDTRSTLTQENPTDIQMRIPDGRVIWVSRRALNMSARTGTPIRRPIVPEDEDASVSSSRGDDVNHILWETRAFIPQTPTHTPAVTSPDNGTTQIGDAAIPDLNLNVANEDMNRIDEAPAEDFYIVPSDYDVLGNFFALAHGRRFRYEEYNLQQQTSINRMPAALNDRFHLVLPNPRNMPTFQFIMRVPYELGREPVNIEVQLPRHGNAATENSDENEMLTFEVSEAAETINEAEAPLDQSLRARRYIQQLPRLDQVDVPELQDQACYICHEPYVFDIQTMDHGDAVEYPVRLPCNHIFGNHCLQTYICGAQRPGFNSVPCPLCRRELPVYQANMEFELPEGVRREPEGVSREEYDEASNAQRSQDWNLFGPHQPDEVSRDAALALELMLPERLAQLQDGEGRGALFEEIQLRGAFRPPHITEEYSAYGEICDEMVYELLKDSRAQWTTRWGECFFTSYLS